MLYSNMLFLNVGVYLSCGWWLFGKKYLCALARSGQVGRVEADARSPFWRSLVRSDLLPWAASLAGTLCTLHDSTEQYLLHIALLLLLLCRLFSAAISSRPTTKVLGGQDFVCVFLALFSIVLLQYSLAKQTQCTRSAVKYVTMVNMDMASCLQPLTPLTQHYYEHYNV